jgi:hypothetical protein
MAIRAGLRLANVERAPAAADERGHGL